MGICLAMPFIMLQGHELKLGIGVGDRPLSFESIFQSDRIKSQRSS